MFAWRVLAPALLSAGILVAVSDLICLGQVAKPTPAGQSVEDILATPVTWDYVETPLRAILHQVQTEHKIDIRLDQFGDTLAGVRIDRPVTRRFQGISLGAALRWTLRDLDMTYVVDSNALRPIPADEAADWQLATQLYPIGDLLRSGFDGKTLIRAITAWVAVHRNPSRGPGMIARILPEQPEVLVVEQPLRAQAKIAGLLEILRRIAPWLAKQDPPLNGRLALPPWERRIVEALDSPTEIATIEMPFQDVVAGLKKRHQIEIQLDQKALDEVGIGPNVPITRKLQGISLRDALRLLLRDLDLTYLVEDEILLITTPEEADTHWSARLYRIDGLLSEQASPQECQSQADALLKALTSLIEPASWYAAGGKGAAAVVPLRDIDALVVEQSSSVHEAIVALLDRIRTLAHANATDAAARNDGSLTLSPQDRKILDTLGQPTQFEFIETPLHDVIDFFQSRHSIEIQIDQRCLDDVGIGTDTPITRNLKGISLRSALRLMLDDLDLAYTIQNGVLLVTTPEEVERQWSIQVYSLADLLPDPDSPTAAEQRDALLKTVSLCAPWESWGEAGGEGGMAVVPLRGGEVLVVRQTWPTHETILSVLQQLRHVALAKPREGTAADSVILTCSQPERIILDTLEQPVHFEFIETPLQDIVDYLKDRHRIEIQIDQKGLDDVGLGTDLPMTRNLKGISLRSALRLLLDDLDLTYTIQNGVLLITTREEVEERWSTQLYSLADLLPDSDGPTASHGRETFLRAISACAPPESWREAGGEGGMGIVSLRGCEVLAVRQTWPAHETILDVLQQLRRVALAKGPEDIPTDGVVLPRTQAERKILDALGRPTSIQFTETPLQDVVDYLKHQHGIEIQRDLKGLDDVGLNTDAMITQNQQNASLAIALQRVLDSLRLTYMIRDETLLITSSQRAAKHRTTQLYLLQWRQKAGTDSPTTTPDVKPLLAKLAASVASRSWDPDGWGRAEVVLLDNAVVLVVTQSPPVHQRVAHWLTTEGR